MRLGRCGLPFLLCLGGCLDINVNEAGAGANGSSAICSAGGTGGGGLRGDAAADSGGTPMPPRATDSVTFRGNLDQTATTLTWDPVHPKTTSNFTTSLTVYDSLGKAIQLDLYFCVNTKASTQDGDSGDWTYHVMTDGANLDFQSDGTSPPVPGSPTQIALGTLRFDTLGRLIGTIPDPVSTGFYPKAALGPQVIVFNFGTGTIAGGSGLDGLTQFAASSAISFVDQSGSGALLSP